MARTYETGLIITGDASGGLKALQATRAEIDRLVAQSNRAAQSSSAFDRAQRGAFTAAQRAGAVAASAAGQYGGLSRQMAAAGAIDPFSTSSASLAANIPLVESATVGLGAYAKAAAGIFGAGRLISIADDWGQVDSRIGMAVRSQRDYNAAQERLTEISRRNYSEFEATAELYMNSVGLLENVGFSNSQALDFVDTVASGITITGANAETSASLIKAFDDALALGAIRSDQFNTINLRGRPILLGLAEAMGTTEAELMRMAQSGQLTTDRWLLPFMSLMGEFQEKTESMPTTVRDAAVVFGNALSRYVGEANKANGATGMLASGIEVLADNIDLVFAVAATAGSAKLAQMLINSGIAARQAALRAQENTEAIRLQNLEAQKHAATLAREQQTMAAFAAADLRRARAAEGSAIATLNAARAEQQRAAYAASLARGTQFQTAADLALSSANDKLAASEAAVAAAKQATTMAAQNVTAVTGTQMVAVAAATTHNGVWAASLRAVHGSAIMARNGIAALSASLGGSVGLLFTVGTMIATWAMFRSSTVEVDRSVSDLSTSIEDATRALRDMTKAQRDASMLDVAKRIEEEQSAIDSAVAEIDRLFRNYSLPKDGFESWTLLDQTLAQVRNGTIDTAEAIKTLRGTFVAFPGSSLFIDIESDLVRLGGAVDSARDKQDQYKNRLEALGLSIDPVSGKIRSMAGVLQSSGQEWDRYITRLQDARNTLGMTAEQEARYQAQKQGFNQFEAEYAAALAGQTEELKAYGQALAAGNQTEAQQHLERAQRYTEQEALYRLQAEAVGAMGSRFAEAARFVNAADSALTATALSTAWAVAQMSSEADSYLQAARAVFNARAQAIRENPGSRGQGGRSEGDKLEDGYKRQADALRQQVALQGQVGEAARVRYQIEHGELAKLSAVQKQSLIELAESVDRQKIAEQGKSMLADLDQRISLYRKSGEAARLAYQLERGELAKLSGETKALLADRARELDLLERRQNLVSSYLPEQSSLLGFAQGQAGINSMLSGDSRQFAQRALDDQVGDFAKQGLPGIQGLDATISGPFGELDRIARETEEYERQYQRRLELLQAYADRRIEIEGATEEESLQTVATARQAIEALEENHRQVTEQSERQMAQARLAGYASMYGDMASVIGVFAGEQSTLYRSMFAVAKGYAVAEALMNVPKTFSNVYTSIAAIPFVGPFIAPVMAAAAAAVQVGQASEIKGMSLSGMAHDGMTSIPREGTWLLDGQERVVAPQQNQDLTRFLERENRRTASSSTSGQSAGADGTGGVVVYVIEDASRAGQQRQFTDDAGRQVVEVVVASIRNEGEVWDAISTKGGLSARGD